MIHSIRLRFRLFMWFTFSDAIHCFDRRGFSADIPAVQQQIAPCSGYDQIHCGNQNDCNRHRGTIRHSEWRKIPELTGYNILIERNRLRFQELIEQKRKQRTHKRYHAGHRNHAQNDREHIAPCMKLQRQYQTEECGGRQKAQQQKRNAACFARDGSVQQRRKEQCC